MVQYFWEPDICAEPPCKFELNADGSFKQLVKFCVNHMPLVTSMSGKQIHDKCLKACIDRQKAIS